MRIAHVRGHANIRLNEEADRKKRSARTVNTKLPDNSLSGLEFKKLKGKLRLPVIGELITKFGTKRSNGGPRWKGLFIKAKEGRAVKAIAKGEVVFADWLGGFGNLLILDHGDGYMSLYANNASLLRQVGEIAMAGDTIASVGNSGGNANSGLYFELRYKGKPFNPKPWVQLD